MPLAQVVAARYVVPLREGGSMPAVVEDERGASWVVKFRGAGQGPAALVAEVIGGEVARAAGLDVPMLAIVELDPAIGKNEGDPEIRSLLLASEGQNVGLAMLPAALPFDAASKHAIDGGLASRIVAIDAFLSNVDRTARNPNLLWCDGRLWLIDHGAALFWQHAWDGGLAGADSPFPHIKHHVLLRHADDLAGAGARAIAAITDDVIAAALAPIPDGWLVASREQYLARLRARREAASIYLEEAVRARSHAV
jgi:hypothetical protein